MVEYFDGMGNNKTCYVIQLESNNSLLETRIKQLEKQLRILESQNKTAAPDTTTPPKKSGKVK